MYFPYDFREKEILKKVKACFVIKIQYVILRAYELCVILSVRLPLVSSRLLVV